MIKPPQEIDPAAAQSLACPLARLGFGCVRRGEAVAARCAVRRGMEVSSEGDERIRTTIFRLGHR